MRMMMIVKLPVEEFNTAVRDGTAGKKLGSILEAIKPEAAYFTERDGHRSATLIVEVPEASKIPALAEPWFLSFNATVEMKIVMSPEDLKKAGLDALGKKWG